MNTIARNSVAFLALPVMVALSGCMSLTDLAYNAEVRKLCKEDGGVYVYQTVSLPPEHFDKFGNIIKWPLIAIRSETDPHIKSGPDTAPYVLIVTSTYLKGAKGDGATPHSALIKTVKQVVRHADKFVLGQSVDYSAIHARHLHPGGESCDLGDGVVSKIFSAREVK